MAVNTDLLRSSLKNYQESLLAHNLILNEDFEYLSKYFIILADAYQGQAGEAFQNSWIATAQWFNNYIYETSLLIRFLEERISWLDKEI